MKCLCMAPQTPVVTAMRGFDFLTIISKTFISRLYFNVFMFNSLLWLLVVSICKFKELKCMGGGRDYWCLAIVGCSQYA